MRKGLSTLTASRPPGDWLRVLNAPDQASGEVPSHHSCVQGGASGAGNLTNAPSMSPVLCRLLAGSPCIDSGTNAAWMTTATDIEDDARFAGTVVDIGADEFVDSDSDGVSDAWELRHFSDLDAADGTADGDADCLTDAEESAWDTDPADADTDGDGASDGAEVAAASSPTTPATPDTLSLAVSIGDKSDKQAEKYKIVFSNSAEVMEYTGLDFGGLWSTNLTFQKGTSYTIRVEHAGTSPVTNSSDCWPEPDYDYIAQIESKPGSTNGTHDAWIYGDGFAIHDPDKILGTHDGEDCTPEFAATNGSGMATLYVPRIETTHIKFDHAGPDKGVSDGLNIRRDSGNDLAHVGNGVGVGEWVLDIGRNEPFLYVITNTVTILAKFRLCPPMTNTFHISAAPLGGLFPATETNGVTFVAGASAYIEFGFVGALNKSHNFDGDADADVARSVDSWQWRVDEINANITITGPHTNYCVLGVPQEPWYEDAESHPWESALDLVCSPSPWAGGTTSITASICRVTEAVHGSGVFCYDAVSGSPHYLIAPLFGAWKVNLSQCILDISSSASGCLVNCEDCANFVTSFANLAGANCSNARMGTWQLTTLSWLPFSCNDIRYIGEPATTWGLDNFKCHRVSWAGSCGDADAVFDATLQYDSDGDPTTTPRSPTVPTNVIFSAGAWSSPCDTYRECLARPGNGYDRCCADGDAVKRRVR